jgi:hypothetical protein
MGGLEAPGGLIDDILGGRRLGATWLRLCAVMAAGAATYGAVCGMWNGARLSAYVAIKLPLVLLLTSALTVGLSWLVAALLGLPLRFGQVGVLTFLALASGALLLASLAPVALLARDPGEPFFATGKMSMFENLGHVFDRQDERRQGPHPAAPKR